MNDEKGIHFGPCIEVLIQAVPPHIVDIGPEWDLLPPPVDPHGRLYRAVFLVEQNDIKGTARLHQEYPHLLLQFTGNEYRDIRFVDLMYHLEEALDSRHGVLGWKSKIDSDELGSYVD
jgi:hypothetical protein